MKKNNPDIFWAPFSDISRLLLNKRKEGRFVFLLLIHYFKNYHNFFKDISEIDESLIVEGIKIFDLDVSLSDVHDFFSQKTRLVYQYQNKIRNHFGFKSFSSISLSSLLLDVKPLFYQCSNDETLVENIRSYLVLEKIEIPESDVLSDILYKLKAQEQEVLFRSISQDLDSEHKNWIDDKVLAKPESSEGLCQFLRQDSGASNKIGIQEEIERLKILRNLPLERFDYINHFPQKDLSPLIRRFLSNTPQKLKNRSEIIRHSGSL